MTSHFCISPDETRIAYDLNGNGPPLMLLHGAGKTRQDWHKLGYVKRLSADFTVITVDIRGSGESAQFLSPADYAVEKICQDLLAVADACTIDHFALWGYSLGGNLARYLAAGSDRVKAMAIIGVPLGPAVDQEFDRYIDKFAAKYAPLVKAAQKTPAKGTNKSTIKHQIPALIACFQAMRDWPLVELSDINCPTLLLFGSKNRRVTTWAESKQQALASAKLQVESIPSLNHPQEFSKINQVYPVVSSFFKSALGMGG